MEASKELLEAIKQALHDEAVGKNIYSKASKNANDDAVKEFFKKMEEEEKSHIRYLSRLYKHIDKEIHDVILFQEVKHKFSHTEEIFDKKFLEEIKNNNSLLLALNTSATLEKNAIAFYSKCEKMAKDSSVREFFKSMVIWETDHLNKILDIFENLDDSEISFKQDDFI